MFYSFDFLFHNIVCFLVPQVTRTPFMYMRNLILIFYRFEVILIQCG